MEEAERPWRKPEVVGIMDQGNELGLVMCEPTRYRAISSSFSSGRRIQVGTMHFPRGGAGRYHDVARNAVAVRSESDEVCSLAFISRDAHQLFRIRVPSGFAGQLNPRITDAVMAAQAWSLSKCKNMVTVPP